MQPTSRLLLVEDNSDDVFLFSRAATRDGHQMDVAVAGSAEEAQEALLARVDPSSKLDHLDLVVTDLKMPRSSGFDLVSWIRSHPELKHLLIVVLSSSTEPRDVKRCYDLGANVYMSKPSSLSGYSALLQTLHKLCRNPQQTPESEFLIPNGRIF